MIKNKFLIFIILVLTLLSISTASAEDSSLLNTTDSEVSVYDESVYVDNDVSKVDNLDVISEESVNSQLKSNFTDLQEKINNQSDNSVLDLDCDYKYNGTIDFTRIMISKNNLTIDGHGHTIDANNSAGIFNVTGNSITLKNLILVNAKIQAPGGAICSTGNLTHIINCTFINNAAGIGISYFSGGAIWNSGDGFMIINSSFTNNTATYLGGAIWNSGDGFMIINSNFTNNHPRYGDGVICNLGVNFTICNSIFTNNYAIYGDGVIGNDGDGFTISDCKFINNYASMSGVIDNSGNAWICFCSDNCRYDFQISGY